MLFRCLVLWSHDTNLDDALKLAKSILIPIDVLNALWPCPGKSHYTSFKTFSYDIFWQLFNKNAILCVNNWSKPVLPPMLSSHSHLVTLFHPSCDPEWCIFSFFFFSKWFWSACDSMYVSKTNSFWLFCYTLPLFFFSCSVYATIRFLFSCINKLDNIFLSFAKCLTIPLFLHLLFFVSF